MYIYICIFICIFSVIPQINHRHFLILGQIFFLTSPSPLPEQLFFFRSNYIESRRLNLFSDNITQERRKLKKQSKNVLCSECEKKKLLIQNGDTKSVTYKQIIQIIGKGNFDLNSMLDPNIFTFLTSIYDFLSIHICWRRQEVVFSKFPKPSSHLATYFSPFVLLHVSWYLGSQNIFRIDRKMTSDIQHTFIISIPKEHPLNLFDSNFCQSFNTQGEIAQGQNFFLAEGHQGDGKCFERRFLLFFLKFLHIKALYLPSVSSRFSQQCIKDRKCVPL